MLGEVLEEKSLRNTMDEARKKVIGRLSNLDVGQLTTICGSEGIVIPPAKTNRKSALENLILVFLSSDTVDGSDDDGLELFTRLAAQMDTMLQDNQTVEEETKPVVQTGHGEGSGLLKANSGKVNAVNNVNSGDMSDSAGGVRSRVVHRLKDYKIEGKIGHGESPLSFQNIEYQVSDGEDLEYTWKEISSGLIKAMKGGSSIRNFFENPANREMPKDEFMKMLESLIDEEEKDSAKLLTEMSSKVQGAREKVLTYVLDMINLRKSIVKMSIEEGNPLSELLVRKWCTHAILVGLRLDPIRMEMRRILKDPMSEEHEVMKKVKELVRMEKEHLQKMGEEEEDDEESSSSKGNTKNNKNNLSGGSGKNTEVNHINASEGWRNRSQAGEKSKGVSFAGEAGKLEIDATVLNAKLDLIANQMGECLEVIPAVRSLENDVKDLKKEMAQLKSQRPSGPPKCEECKKTNTRCNHCVKCGELGHKQATCPKN